MQFSMDSNMQFPLVDLYLNQGETVFIQRGSMVYHTPNVTLNTQLNANGSGLGRFVKAVGRSMVSGESTFTRSSRPSYSTLSGRKAVPAQ